MEQIEIERGVTVTDPPNTKYCAKGGLVTTYHTRQMSPERIAHYGLTRYVADKESES